MVRKIIIMPDYLFYTAASSRMRLRSSHHPDHSAAAAEILLSLVSSPTLFFIFLSQHSCRRKLFSEERNRIHNIAANLQYICIYIYACVSVRACVRARACVCVSALFFSTRQGLFHLTPSPHPHLFFFSQGQVCNCRGCCCTAQSWRCIICRPASDADQDSYSCYTTAAAAAAAVQRCCQF